MAENVLIIAVSYRNTPAVVTRFLASVHAASANSAHTMIVDNGPTSEVDSAGDRICLRDGVMWLEQDNVGYGPGLARGYREAIALGVRPDIIVFCNVDIAMREGAIDELVEVLVSRADVGLVGGVEVRPPSQTVHQAGWLLHSLGARRRRLFHGSPLSAIPSLVEEQGIMPSGAFMAMRREDYDAVGGFDVDFFLYYEEAAMAAKLAACDLGVAIAGKAVFEHIGGDSSYAIGSSASVRYHSARSHILFAHRYRSERHAVPFAMSYRLAMGLVRAILRERQGGGATFQGALQGWRDR